MDLQAALALLAQQHPSTPIRVEIDFIPDAGPVPHWEAVVVLSIDGEDPIVAEGAGPDAAAALEALRLQLIAAPIR